MIPSKYKNLVIEGKINWSCLKEDCPNNCCESPSVRSENLQSLFGISENFIPVTNNDADIIINDFVKKKLENKFIIEMKGLGKFIECKENGKCPFLEKGKCTIYNTRPSSCRAYPIFVDKYKGFSIDIKCPGVGNGWTDIDEVKNMIKSLENVYRSYFSKALFFILIHKNNKGRNHD